MTTFGNRSKLFSLSIILMATTFLAPAQSPAKIHLWPGTVPGDTRPKAADVISDDHGGNVTRIASVTDPVLEIFEPKSRNTTGISVVVCPGGGYSILAVDLEGYEVAGWLNTLGITAYVLHYRVPDNPASALMDAQRAIRIVKNLGTQSKPGIKQVGIMGFSAGGSLSARASTRYADKTYEPVDATDQLSSKPDFALLIYPAYLDQGPNKSLTQELKLDSKSPPMFVFQTADDPWGNSSLVMAGALRDAKVPVELHLLATGGHGYGVRQGNPAAETWPELAAKWLEKLK